MTIDGLETGDLLAGRYRLLGPIGAGGMSVIWRAHDEVLQRLVAVKVLHLELSSDAALSELARREAWAVARLDHPDVANVHDYVSDHDILGYPIGALVLQLVEGTLLTDRVALGPLPLRDAVHIGARVAAVLEQAHSRSVVHRDITPDNIMLSGDRVTVLDFGIAARIGEPDDDSTGASFGTPAYVAPERLDGSPAQAATDVYALGVVIYEMLAGIPPFPIRTWDDVAIDHGVPPAPPVGELPELADLLLRCLRRDPRARPTSAELAAALAELDARPLPARPIRLRAPVLATAGVVLVAGAMVAAVLLLQKGHSPLATPLATPSPPAVTARSPLPLATPSTVSTLDFAAARQQVLSTIARGEKEGSIRKDVAIDLRQLVTQAKSAQEVARIDTAIGNREREGALTPSIAETLRGEVGALAVTLR